MEARHRMLREVFRHYLTLKAGTENESYNITICGIAGCTATSNGVIKKGHEGECELITFNLTDLQDSLRGLSPRKKEAVFYNVIMDMKQKDVAGIMGITTVSVGQYVEQAMLQVAKDVWPETEED